MPTYLMRIEPARPEMPIEPTQDEIELVGQHFAYWQDLATRDIALVVGRTMVAPFIGIAILLAADQAEAENVVAGDPGIAGKIFTTQVQEFGIALKAKNWPTQGP